MQPRNPAENRPGRSKLENAVQSPGCKADDARGEGAYVRLRDRTEGEENAADGVFGRASKTSVKTAAADPPTIKERGEGAIKTGKKKTAPAGRLGIERVKEAWP